MPLNYIVTKVRADQTPNCQTTYVSSFCLKSVSETAGSLSAAGRMFQDDVPDV